MDFTKKFNKAQLKEFAEVIIGISDQVGFKVSSRGWCYIMEGFGHVTKKQFDKIEDNINRCRREGLLPVDFTAEEDARKFHGIENPSDGDVSDTLAWMLRDVLDGSRYFTPDWWEGEEYYIQMVVEKIDLVTLFTPITSKYHIPIANSKGWSSILQRAEYSRRFKEAEKKGLKCVLLYCGDHDPDGLRISDTLRKNLEQVQAVRWNDCVKGYDPSGLIIDRFGLSYEYIQKNKIVSIDNLITGSGIDLSNPSHRNHNLPYVQKYLKKIGARKWEANAIVTTPEKARELVESAITHYVGKDALKRFKSKRDKVSEDYANELKESGLSKKIEEFLNK